MSLGILGGNTLVKAPRRPALGASTLPGTCWDKPGFKECHARKWNQAHSECKATGAPDFDGDIGRCIEVMTDAYAFNDCVPKYCPKEPLRSAPVQVGPVFASGDPCGAKNTVRFVQTAVGTEADGIWGPKSKAAYQKYYAATGMDWYAIAKGCVGTGPYPRKPVAPTPPPSKPEPAKPELPQPAIPSPKKGVSKGAMLAGAGILAVAGVGTYYYGQKKGWF